jgi:hypothetical protein
LGKGTSTIPRQGGDHPGQVPDFPPADLTLPFTAAAVPWQRLGAAARWDR